MSCKKTFLILIHTFIAGLLSLYVAGAICAGQDPLPKLKGKGPLPGSLSGPGVEALDAFGKAPVEEDIKPGKTIQGMLLQAIGMDDVPKARYLISRGAEVNQPFSREGDTPLMLAQSLSMARALVHKGANVSARDAKNGTVLHYAVTRPAAKKLLPFLVESGADINARGWEEKTPLNLAVVYLNETRTADEGIIELLVTLGADINAPDNNGYTGLMQAAATGNDSLADLFLSLGADKTLTTENGKTAKDMAFDSGSRYIYQRLE
ncbi:MAG: ankyrin repeat domain-containing protein [Thermodesulfobacteriota bacterium]